MSGIFRGNLFVIGKSLDNGLLRSQPQSHIFILDKQMTDDALKRLNASLEVGFLQKSPFSQCGVSGHGRWV
jgi:hypothetical protein